MRVICRYLSLLLSGVFLTGCAMMTQDPNYARVREPGYRIYNEPPEAVSVSAKTLWEYAILSDNAYLDATHPNLAGKPGECELSRTGRLELEGWDKWTNVPSSSLATTAEELGLYLEVWEKKSLPAEVVVVFRGTEFWSWRDWQANLRWFLRFIPLYPDQYTLVAEEVGKEVLEELKKRIDGDEERYKNVKLISTGHSLGGGLAQHLAYSLPPITLSNGTLLPRVSEVYGFDPSPVTGWYSVDTELRTVNSQGLKITRIFEHGEALAYIRLLLRYVNPPSESNPAIREIRYNFVQSINPFASHSMRLIACELLRAKGNDNVAERIP